MAISPPPTGDSGRTLIYDGLAQNDIDMAFHRLLNLDLSNLPPSGIPPTIVAPPHNWLDGWDAPTQTWSTSQPSFADIHGGLTSGPLGQQRGIFELGTINVGIWNATPLLPAKVPTLDAIRLPLANVNMASKRLTFLADPVDAQDAVNKRFMDSLLMGLVPHEAVKCATTAATTFLGAPIIDGVPTFDGDRVLVKDQTIRPSENGIYIISSTGHWLRSTDCDVSAEFPRAFCAVLLGTQNGGTSWVQVTPSFAHDPPAEPDVVHFIQFSALPGGSVITPGAGLTLVSGVLNVGGTLNRIAVGPDNVDIDPAYAGQNSITTVGTITAGTWFGDTIDGARGGTGVSNVGKLITVCGNVTTAIPFGDPDVGATRALTFFITNNTSLILPTVGTVSTLANVETLTNKNIVKRTQKIATSAKPAINVDHVDVFHITGLNEPIVSMTDNLNGTPANGQELFIWIFNNTGSLGPGTSIIWGSKFIGSPAVPLVTMMLPFTRMLSWFIYNDDISKWVLAQKLEGIA